MNSRSLRCVVQQQDKMLIHYLAQPPRDMGEILTLCYAVDQEMQYKYDCQPWTARAHE